MSGRPATLYVGPSAEPGIHVRGGGGRAWARVGPDTSGSELRSSSVVGDGARIRGVEHLLGACAGLGVWNLRISAPENEVPGFDGSAVPFLDMLDSGPFAEIGENMAPLLCRRARLELGDARIRYEPFPADALEVYYRTDFRVSGGSVEEFGLIVEPVTFRREIAAARSFAVRGLDAAPLPGLEGPPLWTDTPPELRRHPDELARHKILDLLGDLAFLGAPLHGRIVADRAGHALHRALVQTLAGGARC